MLMRIGLIVLWFATGWMASAMTAFAVGLPPEVAPVVAVATAGFVGWWSGRREWRGRQSPQVAATFPHTAPAA